MHPDRKIGFAMGILLIGIVGALFFRNEPLVMDEVPTVRREKQLNEQLRARDVSVYLNDESAEDIPISSGDSPRWTLQNLVEDLSSRNDGVPLPVGISEKIAKSDSAAPASLEEPLSIEASESADTDPAAREPVRIAMGEGLKDRPLPPLMPQLKNSDTVPSKNADTAETDGELFPGLEQTKAADVGIVPAGDFEEYTVRYGDTLSHIAERFLGSQSRFQEIFEANRDRISAPDKLQVGKSLRIPRK
ncbi:MAG: LysM peptidoglycan-binding domain-containing protein [Planctomycetaceae bacterium]